MILTCKPSTQEVEAEGSSGVLGQLQLYSETPSQETNNKSLIPSSTTATVIQCSRKRYQVGIMAHTFNLSTYKAAVGGLL